MKTVSKEAARVRAYAQLHGYVPEVSDECALRKAWTILKLKSLLGVVTFPIWGFWRWLYKESGMAFAVTLAATIVSALTGLLVGLYFVDPVIPIKILVGMGVVALGLLFIVLCATLGICLSEEDRGERAFYTVADSWAGKTVAFVSKTSWNWCLKYVVLLVFLPSRFVVRDLCWRGALRGDPDIAVNVAVVAIVAFFVLALGFLLVAYLVLAFLASAFWTLVGIFSALGLIVVIILGCILYGMAEESGTVSALAGVVKDRFCQMVRIV